MGQSRRKQRLLGDGGPWRRKWRRAWPDAVAFLFGIAVAAVFGWRTSELLWSLWLSTTVVGFTFVLWAGLGMARMELAEAKRETGHWRILALVFVVLGVCSWLLFTGLHFGGFQLLHSVALNQYFPISSATFPPAEDPWMYGRVIQCFWYFLPAAFLAERHSFAPWPRPGTVTDGRKWASSVTFKVYLAVIRMHLLLLFLAVIQPESLWVYSVIYLLYFFPWSLLRSPSGESA
ncbi:MAG: hypothetical protein SF066_07430 [Thermoanaerobaculia bacterium]|nr:hypothetical protein [Thermoanaerobaculia bacterium]